MFWVCVASDGHQQLIIKVPNRADLGKEATAQVSPSGALPGASTHLRRISQCVSTGKAAGPDPKARSKHLGKMPSAAAG